jgi:glycosyltransferase involved in cell wall biosynthesis
MKILLISHYWHNNSHHSLSSGYERVAFYLAKDHQVSVLTGGKQNATKKLTQNLRLIARKIPNTNFFFEKRLALSFEALKISKNYDIIHALYSDVGLFPAFKFPTIITEHTLKELENTWWMKYKSILQKITYSRVKLIITVSDNLKTILEEKYGLNNKVITIPHGIDTKIYFPRKLTKNDIDKKQQLLGKYKYLCFSCGIQGIDSQTFINIARLFPQILFIVVGRKENTNLPNVMHPGKISEEKMIEFYSLADFCFKPLKFATANNAILEAMAMGKVTITNRMGGVTDYLDDSCGYLAPTVSDFPKIFKRVMNRANEVKDRGKKAREKAVKEFSWEVVATKILKAYQRVWKNSI